MGQQTASPSDFDHPDNGHAHAHNQEIWQSVHGSKPYPWPATAQDRDGDGK